MRLYIIGRGGHAAVVAEAAGLRSFEVRYVVPAATLSDEIAQADFVANGEGLLRDAQLICGVGSVGRTTRRLDVLGAFEHLRASWATVVHPTADVAGSAVLGPGTFVAQGAIVGTAVTTGRHAILNTGSIVDHDTTLGDAVHVAPGATVSGGVRLGRGVHVGTGAAIIQGVTIADHVVLGAGAVVTESITDPASTWVGVPARRIA